MKAASRYLLALLATLVLCVFAAACGDDGDTSSGEALSKEEFIAQADEICAAGDAQIDAQGEDFTGRTDPSAREALVTTVIVPGTRDQLEQIRALSPPEGDEDEVNEFLDTLDRGLDELEDDPELLAAEEGPATILDARKLAMEYGFKSCDRGGGEQDDGSGISLESGATGPKGEFIAQADRICAQTAARTQKTVDDVTGGKPATPAQREEVAELTASGIEDQVSGIRGLTPPEGDEEQIEAILSAAEEGAEEIRNDPDSLGAGGVPNERLAEANDLAVAYGLTVCGS